LDVTLKHFPLWKLQNIEDEAPLNSFPTVNLALQWSQKKYGLDEVFERVQNDNILLEFDFDKMKDILDKAFAKHRVDESQLKYLQRKYKTIKRHHQNSFTELYMQNLLHLVEHIQSMNDLEFLPDLQETQTTCDQNDIDLVDSYIQNSGMESQCTLLRIRAGIFLKEDCLSTLNSYLNQHNNVKLIIHALPHDFLPVKDFVTALNAVGKESVLLDLPQVALEKIRTLSGFPAIPNTNRIYNEHQNDGRPPSLKENAATPSINTAIITYVKVIFIALLLVFF